MKKTSPAWFNSFRSNYIQNYIFLVIRAYHNIPKESHKEVKLEGDRRTELVKSMRHLKNEFYINFPIAYETGEGTKRMDICCYLDGLSEDYYICFECKRFLSQSITNRNFDCKYYNEGIKRFEHGQYSPKMSQAGMLSFLETGTMVKLENLMRTRLPQTAADSQMEDISKDYFFPHVFKTLHNRGNGLGNIHLYHILLDFT